MLPSHETLGNMTSHTSYAHYRWRLKKGWRYQELEFLSVHPFLRKLKTSFLLGFCWVQVSSIEVQDGWHLPHLLLWRRFLRPSPHRHRATAHRGEAEDGHDMAIAVSALKHRKHVVSGRNWMGLELNFFAIFMGKNMETWYSPSEWTPSKDGHVRSASLRGRHFNTPKIVRDS